MQNYKMILQYDGTRYRGWQKQGNTAQTIQGKLESVLEKMTGEPVEVHGSGRTDAGVHALAQVANVKIKQDKAWTADTLQDYLNRYLPEDIAVLSVEPAEARFHSRLSAVEKTYCYKIETARVRNVFNRKYTSHLPEKLDIEAMRTAACQLIGTHDFTSFCGNKHMKKSAVRTINAIQIEQMGTQLHITVTGNGFLQNMVRILVGTLVEVGEHKRSSMEMEQILAAKDRQCAGRMMPPEGLYLVEVRYE